MTLQSSLIFYFTIDVLTKRTNLTIKTTKTEEPKFKEKSFFNNISGFIRKVYGVGF